MRSAIDRRKELLSDIRDRCLKIVSTETQQKVSKLAASWNQIKERIKWLSYEPYIDDQPSIDEVQDICEALIRRGQLEQDQKDNARRVAELGLERCKEDTTDIFICLLLGAQEDGDQKRFQALYSRAKKRKKVDLDRVDSALR